MLIEFKSDIEGHFKVHDRGEDVFVERAQNINRRGWRLGSKKNYLCLALVEVKDILSKNYRGLLQRIVGNVMSSAIQNS